MLKTVKSLDSAGSEGPPRLLIVSSCAPGKGHVGELILRDVVLAFPPGHCVVLSTRRPSQPDADLDALYRLELMTKVQGWSRQPRGGRIARLAGSIANWLRTEVYARLLARRAAEVAREVQIDKVWVILDSVALITAAPRIAKAIPAPLLSLVWDPPGHLTQHAHIGALGRKMADIRFKHLLGISERVAVVSDNMSKDYAEQFGARTILLRRGLQWQPPAVDVPRAGDAFVIGFAGALHAKTAWDALLAGLESVDWRVGGRAVRLRVLTSSLSVSCRGRAAIEYLGWRDDAEALALLAACDATYLPFPFEPHLSSMARYSFPTKLSSYLSLGLPILAHAPQNSSVEAFMRCHRLGISCSTLEPAEIVEALERLVAGPWTDIRLQCKAVHESAFSRTKFLESLAEFSGCSPRMLV